MANEAHGSVTATTDEDRAVATITMAFTSDPVVRWFLPDAGRYLAYWPQFVKAMAGKAFPSGSAYAIDGCGGAALWLPPGVGSDEEAMGAIAAEAVPDEDQEEVFGFMGQMGEFHPTETHWYLPVIGVDLNKQGRGYGSALLAHALAACDEDHLPAYLEATSPRNKRLYESHGFEELGVIQAGTSPPMWPMLRKAR